MKKQSFADCFRGLQTIILDMLIIIGMIVVMVFAVAGHYTDDDVAISALEERGMTDVRVVDHAYFFMSWRGGRESDIIRYECEAVDSKEQKVRMYVFTGFFSKSSLPAVRTL